jgi:hypothetical protein
MSITIVPCVLSAKPPSILKSVVMTPVTLPDEFPSGALAVGSGAEAFEETLDCIFAIVCPFTTSTDFRVIRIMKSMPIVGIGMVDVHVSPMLTGFDGRKNVLENGLVSPIPKAANGDLVPAVERTFPFGAITIVIPILPHAGSNGIGWPFIDALTLDIETFSVAAPVVGSTL